MDFMVDFGIDIHILLQKSESHVRSSLGQGVPGWLTSVLQIKLWWFSLFFRQIQPTTAWEKFKPIIDLFKTRENRFEVIFTSDLKMLTWKPISIEAIKVFNTSLNQPWAEGKR